MKIAKTFFCLMIFLGILGQAVIFAYDLHVVSGQIPALSRSPHMDGLLTDPIWQQAPLFTDFKMVHPQTGASPTEKTELRVLFDHKNLYIGVFCFTQDPTTIAVTDLSHDQEGDGNDNIRILIDPFQDKRNAYVFLVNPKGARTEGLAGGEYFSTNWDGIWEAKSKILPNGWSTEIRIPFKTLSFNPKLESWGFNVERYIAQRMEVIRLSGISKDSFFYNPAEAASLDGIKNVKQGNGFTFKPFAILDTSEKNHQEENRVWKVNGGFDLYKNFTPNLVGVLTYRTDFAETEVDERQINLTRFSLYFPEKRAFFLEGSEIFEFEGSGGFSPAVIPFFSRNIGLYQGEQVPVLWGGKLYGKIGNTNIALLDVKTKSIKDIPGQNFFAGRIYQNIFSESKIGMIFTAGEPGTTASNTLLGVDFKYATSRFMKNKNFSVGGWWVTNHNQYQEGNHSGYGFKIDYPNDLIDTAASYAMVGDALNPGLGFVPRNNIHLLSANFQYKPRPEKGLLGKWFRQMFLATFMEFYWDLQGNLESTRVSFSPFTYFETESGDTFEFFLIHQKEVLKEPFELSPEVVIPPGDYDFVRYQFEIETAAHRFASMNIEYETGGFYNGTLSNLELALSCNIKGNIKLGLEGNFVHGDLPQGTYKENLYRAKADFYLNPDLGLMTYLQYDSVSENIGVNFRFKWNISPGNTIYFVYNKSWEQDLNRLEHSNRFWPMQDRGIFKVQFTWRP